MLEAIQIHLSSQDRETQGMREGITVLEGDTACIQADIKDVKADIARLQESSATATAAIQGLEVKVEVANKDIAEMKEGIVEMKAMLKSVAHTLSSVVDFISRDGGGPRPKPSRSGAA